MEENRGHVGRIIMNVALMILLFFIMAGYLGSVYVISENREVQLSYMDMDFLSSEVVVDGNSFPVMYLILQKSKSQVYDKLEVDCYATDRRDAEVCEDLVAVENFLEESSKGKGCIFIEPVFDKTTGVPYLVCEGKAFSLLGSPSFSLNSIKETFPKYRKESFEISLSSSGSLKGLNVFVGKCLNGKGACK